MSQAVFKTCLFSPVLFPSLRFLSMNSFPLLDATHVLHLQTERGAARKQTQCCSTHLIRQLFLVVFCTVQTVCAFDLDLIYDSPV